MINNQNLRIELSKFGRIIFCDIANEHCWNVILDTDQTVIDNIKTVCDSFLFPEYDLILSMTLEDNIFIASYFKEPI